MNKEQVIKVTGMTCAACAKAVERVTKKLDGVESASVNIATEKLNIKYDNSKSTYEEIKSAIEKAGYGVLEEVKSKEVIIPIGGMTCAACAKAVERASKKVDGVSEASVNLATEKLTVTFDESKTNLDAISAAITKAGYGASIESTTATIKVTGMT